MVNTAIKYTCTNPEHVGLDINQHLKIHPKWTERVNTDIMKVVYIAHPVAGDDKEKNLLNAEKWVGYLIRRFNIAPICDWITICKNLDELYREIGMVMNKELIRRCDELWLVGGRISKGMQFEKEFAQLMEIPVIDLTHLGYEVPSTEMIRE